MAQSGRKGERMSQTHMSHLWPGVPLALTSVVLFGLSGRNVAS
jgi:hypothetical protein